MAQISALWLLLARSAREGPKRGENEMLGVTESNNGEQRPSKSTKSQMVKCLYMLLATWAVPSDWGNINQTTRTAAGGLGSHFALRCLGCHDVRVCARVYVCVCKCMCMYVVYVCV